MFSSVELETLSMSELVLIAGGDWDTEDIDIEFIILSNTATQLEEQLIDLDRLLTIYYEASLLKLYNTQLKELKSIRESLANI